MPAPAPQIRFAEDQLITPLRIQGILERIGHQPIWPRAPIFILDAFETGTSGSDLGNGGLFVTTLMLLEPEPSPPYGPSSLESGRGTLIEEIPPSGCGFNCQVVSI